MEELGPWWDKSRPGYAATNRDYRDGHVYSEVAGIIGYFSGRSTGPDRMKTYMQVAASARERLKAAAAAQWGVKTSEIDAQNSVLTHKSSGRTLRFGEVGARAAKVKLELEPTPKDRSQWTFLTKTSPAKVQIPEIVNGAAVYGIDVRLPHMVYAALRQSPVHGGKLKSYDADAIKNLPGVLAVVAVRPQENKPSDLNPPFPFGVSPAQHGAAVIANHSCQPPPQLPPPPAPYS